MTITKDNNCVLTRLTGAQADAIMEYTNDIFNEHKLHYDCYDLGFNLWDLKVYHTEQEHRDTIAQIVLDN
ncbi:hypothetical protein CMI37_27545 [Candidatus Pacearchaeota archaeon]|jgi:tRNA splicing ligase|nr:hypothetical protein [Candidatus Pacearchaeota archaeon]